jgi:transcriptional regulator with XRE-family HTH domain
MSRQPKNTKSQSQTRTVARQIKSRPPVSEAVAQVDKVVVSETGEVLTKIGANVRRMRFERGMTLQALAQASGLSSSMLSLLERGKTGPSISTLVVLASALDVQMMTLLGGPQGAEEPVSRRDAQPSYVTAEGVRRRVVRADLANGVEIAINEYKPGTASGPQPTSHQGVEFGLVLDGVLEISLNDRVYTLTEGDLISYRSTDPHRISNEARRSARALWINFKPRRGIA